MILDLDKYKEIWQTITRNKTRSLLTAFGVFWGIFMFVILMGVGNALQGGMMKGVTSSAKNSMMVFDNKTSVEYKGFNAGRYWNMTTDDAAVIAKTIPEIEHVSSSLFMGTQSLVYKDFSESFNMRGVDENIYFVDTQILLAGRLLNKIDVDQKRKVCVIGKTISEKLFSSYEEAIGTRISLGGRYYTIVGVATSNSQISMGGRIDDNILIPITVGQQIYNYGKNVHGILISVYDNVDITTIEPKVKQLLKSRHFIAPEDETAVNSFNVQKAFLTFSNLFLGIEILIWIVGMGTLLAGVVGVSNIMLITIRERTKEIGIRRALGASPQVIIRQILSESIALTLISGFLGLFFGLLILVATEQVVKNSARMLDSPVISFNVALLAVFILILAGACAGIVPAVNAIRIKAIDALRDE